MCILALDSGDTYKLIESGELEAGLIANPGYSRTVASIPLFQEPMCFVCGAKAAPTAVRFIPHPCRSEMKSIWSGILSLSCGTPTGSETGRRCRVETDNMRLLGILIEQDEYWSVLPKSVALSMEGRMDVRILPIEDGPEDRVVYLLLKHKEDCPPSVRILLQMLKEYLEKLGILWIEEGKI